MFINSFFEIQIKRFRFSLRLEMVYQLIKLVEISIFLFVLSSFLKEFKKMLISNLKENLNLLIWISKKELMNIY
jgi:hypothetical protein